MNTEPFSSSTGTSVAEPEAFTVVYFCLFSSYIANSPATLAVPFAANLSVTRPVTSAPSADVRSSSLSENVPSARIAYARGFLSKDFPSVFHGSAFHRFYHALHSISW